MTYAIVARCPITGHFGIAVASYSIAIGRHCDGALRAHTGVALTLGNPNPRNNYLAINLLAQGCTAAQALDQLLSNDPDSEYRQVAIVDRDAAIAHSGAKLRPWSGHRDGAGYCVFGDMLAGKAVLDALAEGYEREPQAGLDERLVQALAAGRDAGGLTGGSGRLPERSAALIVWGSRPYNEIDLRVDLHEDAIADLKRIYVDYKPSIAYYEERAKSPRNAVPAMEFVEKLAAGREAR
ncbi:MAG TPA: DUF1028 domain-containing protein [Burkholderiales bacterium]|nr:DUF1028 domain-containing protein [Burkholderiales bacterium]